MMHTLHSYNKFFERPSTVDGSNDTPAPARPPAGTVIKVELYRDGTDLPDLVLDAGGLYDYGWDDDAATSAVMLGVPDSNGVVPADGWDGPFWSEESYANQMGSTDLASQAIQQVQVLDGKVTALQDQVTTGVAGVSSITTPAHPAGLSGTVDLTAAEVGARAAGPIQASDVQGLAAVATDPRVSNLLDYVTPIPLSNKGAANGVPTLDGSKKIPAAFLPSGFGTVGTVSGVGPDNNGDVPKATLITALGVATTTDLAAYAKTASLAKVATTNNYNDLNNKPAASAGMLVCNPSTGAWPARPTGTDPVWWDSVLRSKQVGSDVVPPSGSGGAIAGDHRMSWSA